MTTTLMTLMLAACAQAATGTLAKESAIWIEGDSTLHPFSSTATAVEFAADVEGTTAKALTLRIPVDGLRSAHKGLDSNLQKALKSKEHPAIEFALTKLAVEKGEATADGELTIAGVKKPVTVKGVLAQRDGRLVVDGRRRLVMSEFGVKPPKMMMGAVKVADPIDVVFHLEIETDKKGER